MQKKTEKKSTGKSTKARQWDMLRRDVIACQKKHDQEVRNGIGGASVDVRKDDICLGCRYAFEKKPNERSGFERFFECYGLRRVEELLQEALNGVIEVDVQFDDMNSYWGSKPLEYAKGKAKQFVAVQKKVLDAAKMLGELVAYGAIPCLGGEYTTSAKDKTKLPKCYCPKGIFQELVLKDMASK